MAAASSIVLLRGINVGGRRKVSMAALRTWLTAAGFKNVQTYVQSGNVVLEHDGPGDLADRVAEVLGANAGFDVAVVTRTRNEITRLVARNPFPGTPPTQLHVAFLADPPSSAEVKSIRPDAFAPEEFAVRGRDVYLHLPNGMGRAKMPPRLRFLATATTRNWNTVVALADLADSR
jgi:uncharacterized protein (DUF1697 family)